MRSAALHDPRLATRCRVAAVCAICALTISIGGLIALKAPYYGLPLPFLGLSVGLCAWLTLTRRTGLALAVTLLYLGLVDGVIKLKTGGQAATLGRDVVLYAVAIGVAVRSRGPLRLPPLGGLVLAWVVVVLVQLANPANSSMGHAIVSLRQDLEFVPLFFLGYAVLRSHESLYAFFALLLLAASINGAVAAYQGSLTPKQLASWGPGYNNLIIGPGGRTFVGADGKPRIRPPGLGSDEGFSGLLGLIALPGGIALLVAYRRRRWLLALIVLGIVGAAVGVLTSQSRSYLIGAIVAVVAVLWLMAVGGQAGRAVLAVCLATSLAGIAVLAIAHFDHSTFYRYSSIAPNSAASTIYSNRAGVWADIPNYMRHVPLGVGLGAVGPAAGKLGAEITGPHGQFRDAESQFTFTILETGVPGLLVLLAFEVAMFRLIFKGLKRERDPDTVMLMAGLAAPLFGIAALWLDGVTTTSPPTAPYLWFSAGAIGWWLVTRQRAQGEVVTPHEPRGDVDTPHGTESEAVAHV